MKILLQFILLTIPAFISCQTLPIEELKKQGITSLEISETNKLNGNNGYQDNYLIYRSKRETKNTSKEIIATHFGLSIYNKSKKLKFVIPWEFGFSDVQLFEFKNKVLTIVLKRNRMVQEIEIIEYDIEVCKLIRKLSGEIACEYLKECNWINYENKKLAFFTNLKLNLELKSNSVYEYCWNTNESRLITKVKDHSMDSGTGINHYLKSVVFNTDINEFEYDH